MPKPARTIIVGVGGGSGTGKSTIAAHLATKYRGVHVDGDRVGHEVLADPTVAARVRDTFGSDVLDPSGRVDRRRLGRVVFGDASLLRALNAIVHPAVVARCVEAVVRARVASVPLVVVDAALLMEVPMPFGFDLTIALTCDRGERIRRLLSKGGWSEDEVRARLDRQEGMEKHFYKADAVVDTGRDLAAVLADVEVLVDAVVKQRSRET